MQKDKILDELRVADCHSFIDCFLKCSKKCENINIISQNFVKICQNFHSFCL